MQKFCSLKSKVLKKYVGSYINYNSYMKNQACAEVPFDRTGRNVIDNIILVA